MADDSLILQLFVNLIFIEKYAHNNSAIETILNGVWLFDKNVERDTRTAYSNFLCFYII